MLIQTSSLLQATDHDSCPGFPAEVEHGIEWLYCTDYLHAVAVLWSHVKSQRDRFELARDIHDEHHICNKHVVLQEMAPLEMFLVELLHCSVVFPPNPGGLA